MEIIEHAIVDNEVTDIDNAIVLEEHEDFEEESKKDVEKGPASREIGEMDIDKDLKGAGAIKPAKKKKKKKKKNKARNIDFDINELDDEDKFEA